MNVVAGVVMGLVVAVVLYKWLFHDIEEFFDGIRYIATPNWVSAVRGEYDADTWMSLKFTFWLVMTILMGYGTYAKFDNLF